jgi:hypothetical protein
VHGLGWVLCALGTACGGGEANRNRTFYSIDESPESPKAVKHEIALQRLDANVGGRAFVGMSVLDGKVNISRPADWRVRRAALGDDAYIEYVSPRGFICALYDRHGSKSWTTLDEDYIDDVDGGKAKATSKDVPVATANAQGRAFTIERKVAGARGPYENTSREIILRGSHRAVLVEIVFEGKSIDAFDELLHVFETLEVD